MNKTSKANINPMPKFFDAYIKDVMEEDVIVALRNSLLQWESLDWSLLNKIGNRVYQEGKWSIKDLLQHINDNERVQGYRMMRFARKDATPLPGYDEDLFVANANANERSLENLRDEFVFLRKANLNMIESFDAATLMRSGICFNIEMSVLALGFVLVGHQIHHLRVMEERYYSLVQ